MSVQRKDLLLSLLIIALACVAYVPTVMPDISASPHHYFTDVGNVQNALNLWGTLHSSGYPFFSLTGALFVAVLRGLGVVPAAAASLFTDSDEVVDASTASEAITPASSASSGFLTS